MILLTGSDLIETSLFLFPPGKILGVLGEDETELHFSVSEFVPKGDKIPFKNPGEDKRKREGRRELYLEFFFCYVILKELEFQQ